MTSSRPTSTSSSRGTGLVGFRQVTDLHLLNLAARHAARLVTFDAKIAPALAPDDRDLVRTLT